MAADPKHNERSAADYLDLAPATLRRWRCVGGGPEYLKLGGAIRYRQSALDRFEAERIYQRTQPRSRTRAS